MSHAAWGVLGQRQLLAVAPSYRIHKLQGLKLQGWRGCTFTNIMHKLHPGASLMSSTILLSRSPYAFVTELQNVNISLHRHLDIEEASPSCFARGCCSGYYVLHPLIHSPPLNPSRFPGAPLACWHAAAATRLSAVAAFQRHSNVL